MQAVADAYKHEKLDNQELPISSDRDVLVVGLAFGLEDYGEGKFGRMVEVIVRDKNGEQWKFLADAPVAVAGWMRSLNVRGAMFPPRPYHVCGLLVHP